MSAVTDDDELQLWKEEEKELDREILRLKNILKDREKVMDALHRYNEIKDTTQVVLGQLADIQGITVSELHMRFNLPLKD